MAELPDGFRIETVRGAIGDETAAAVRGFWSARGALEGAEAERRLGEVLCVLRDEAGEVAGVNSAFEREIGVIGGRRFWVYRSLLEEQSAAPAMINAAFDALADGFDRHAGGPVGLCVPVGDREEMERRPEPIWEDTDLLFAGWTPDDNQLRVRYLPSAVIGPGLPNSPTLEEAAAVDYSLPQSCRVEAFGEGSVSADDVLDLWKREDAMPEEEAERRVDEVLNVVVDDGVGLIALSTAYLERNDQLRMDLRYFRTFVATANRHVHVATQLTFHNRDLLDRRFASGEDTRAAGVAFALENEGMAAYYNVAVWQPADFVYIGDNAYGHPVRVHYHPGARIPPHG